MGLWDIITGLVATNVGMGVVNILIILLVLGSIILRARHFQLGTIINFMLCGGVFIVFYNFDLNYAPFLVIMFIELILLVLSLWASNRAAQEGVII